MFFGCESRTRDLAQNLFVGIAVVVVRVKRAVMFRRAGAATAVMPALHGKAAEGTQPLPRSDPRRPFPFPAWARVLRAPGAAALRGLPCKQLRARTLDKHHASDQSKTQDRQDPLVDNSDGAVLDGMPERVPGAPGPRHRGVVPECAKRPSAVLGPTPVQGPPMEGKLEQVAAVQAGPLCDLVYWGTVLRQPVALVTPPFSTPWRLRFQGPSVRPGSGLASCRRAVGASRRRCTLLRRPPVPA
jgi:hypothetical protein